MSIILSIIKDWKWTEDDEVNHQSYRLDLNIPQGNTVYEEVGAFPRGILEEEFNNKKIFGKRYQNRKKF